MPDGIILKRIIDMDEAQQLSSSDYVLVDSQTGGNRKYKLGEDLNNLKDDLAHIASSAVPTTVRQAIKTLFETGGYADMGLTDEMAVISSWASQVTAIALNQSSISISGATTSQLVATTTPAGGAVTWSSSDTSVATVSSNGLVTSVGNGTATITATSGDVSATCTATISGFKSLVSISAVYTQSGTVYDTDSLDDLKADLVVTGLYDDQSTETVTEYTLSGTLEVGTSTITVTYSGKTTTFNVTVTEPSLYQVEYRGNYTTNTPSNTRVTLITGDVTFAPGDTVTIDIASGYKYFIIQESATGTDTQLNRTARDTNNIYVTSVSSSGYITDKNTAIVKSYGEYITFGTGGWKTVSDTISLPSSKTVSYSIGGLSFYVEKESGDEITIAEAEEALTITLP